MCRVTSGAHGLEDTLGLVQSFWSSTPCADSGGKVSRLNQLPLACNWVARLRAPLSAQAILVMPHCESLESIEPVVSMTMATLSGGVPPPLTVAVALALILTGLIHRAKNNGTSAVWVTRMVLLPEVYLEALGFSQAMFVMSFGSMVGGYTFTLLAREL